MPEHVDDTADSTRVLLVEDHRVLAEALAEALGAATGVEVCGIATTLAEAHTLTAACEPDVVVMDVRLPDGDGADGVPDLLRLRPEAKVVLLSASTSRDVRARAVEAGAAGFLPKTAGLAQILEAIERVDEGAVLFSPEDVRLAADHLRRQHRRGGLLTPREREVLRLLAEGASTEDIAARLVISPHTVRNHVRHIIEKLGVHTKLEAVAVATREGLVEAG
ncbi:response regulator [Egicoccus sp. AB-alg2]|uniref:response regulator transcription factor n=1 Tax=Egicoccus sp. AB-alg2 TaxID=3242693 RepID=UPI00359CD4BB